MKEKKKPLPKLPEQFPDLTLILRCFFLEENF